MRGADIGSDHHLLVGKMKIKLKTYGSSFCKEGKRVRFQVNLLQDPQKLQEFHLDLKNRFELLGTLEDVDVDGQWEKVKEVMKSTCSSVLGEQRKPRSGWITLESLERIGKRREAKQVRTRKEKLEAHRKYSELNKSVKNSIKKDKNVFLEGLAERAEKAAARGQMKIVYDTTRIISGKHRTSITRPVKDKHGHDVYEQEGQLNRWRKHFEQLLNRPPPESPPEILPKLKWTDKIRNEQLWKRTGQVPIQTEIGRRRWKWVGHTLRKGKNSITRQALQWNPQGSRGRGRPRETWRRCMEREMKDIGMTWVALSKKAQDRDVWRSFVCGLYPDRGERQ